MIWCCTCPTSSTCSTASGRPRPASATSSRWPACRPRGWPARPAAGAAGARGRDAASFRLRSSRRPAARAVRARGGAGQGAVRPRRPVRGGAEPRVPRRCCGSPAAFFERLRAAQPGAVRVLPQPRRGRVPGRRLAGDVRAGDRRPGGDLPDRRDDRRAAPTRWPTPRTSATLLTSAKEESELTMCTDVDRNDKSRVCEPGSVRGHRPPADRDLQPADPHRGPRRGPAAARFRRAGRVPDPHVGGDRHRRAQDLGDAVHRGSRGRPAALVRRRGRDDRVRRRDEHRPHPAHRAHQRRRRRGAGRRHAAVRLRPGGRGARDPAEGPRAAGDARRGARGRRQAGHRARRTPRPAGSGGPPGDRAARAAGRPPGLVRAHPGRLLPRAGRGGDHAAGRVRPGAARRVPRPTWWCCRRGQGARRTSAATSCWARWTSGGSAAFGVCLGLQAMVEHAGGRAGLLADARARQAGPGAGARRSRCWPGCPPSSPRRGTTRCYAVPGAGPGRVRGDRGDRRTAW